MCFTESTSVIDYRRMTVRKATETRGDFQISGLEVLYSTNSQSRLVLDNINLESLLGGNLRLLRHFVDIFKLLTFLGSERRELFSVQVNIPSKKLTYF